MKIPARLMPLYEDGLIDEVLYQLMSGKEATVYVVRSGDETRCAKVYKEAAQRSFKQAVTYQEGRKQVEEAWQNAEVDALYRVARAGVRVPRPYGCFDGVLLMELVTDDEGEVAPRLAEVDMTAEQAREDHALMMQYIKLMLCDGLVHGDLSEFNVLVDDYGPVIIDLPQAVDAAANNHARDMLTRDVNKIRDYYALFAPELRETRYAKEMWSLYEEGELLPETALSGEAEEDLHSADVDAVLQEIKAALAAEAARRARLREAEEPD